MLGYLCGEVGRVWQPLWEMWGDGELGARPHARNRARPGVSGPRNKCVQGGLGVPETLLVGSLVVVRQAGVQRNKQTRRRSGCGPPALTSIGDPCNTAPPLPRPAPGEG